MNIFIDFDYTLFNTGAFKKEYFNIFPKYGVPEDFSKKCYDKLGIFFSVTEHLREIQLSYSVSQNKILGDIERLWPDLKSFVFCDVYDFLSEAGQSSHDLRILSCGNEEFQEWKIKKSGLAPYFKDIIITQDELKILPFGNSADKKEPTIFLDDRAYVVDAVKGAYPWIKAIHVMREEGFDKIPSKNADAVIKNLSDKALQSLI